MKIFEIASGLASITGFIATLFFQWQGDKTPRNYIAAAPVVLFVIFVLLRRKRKSASAGSPRANISKRNTGVSNQIIGNSNQISVVTSPPPAPQEARKLVSRFGVFWDGIVPYCPACRDVPMHTIVSGGVPLSFCCAKCNFAIIPVDENGKELSPPEAVKRMSAGAPADPDLDAYRAKLSELRDSGGAANGWTIPLNNPDRPLFERLAERGVVVNSFGDHFIPENSLNPRIFSR